MIQSSVLKILLLVSLSMMTFGCNDDYDDDVIIELQLGGTTDFFIYKSLCFGSGDDYLMTAYAELDDIDTNHLFGVVINTYIVSRCSVRTKLQLSSTATATLGEHWVRVRFVYAYYDDFFEERRYGTKTAAIQITINETIQSTSISTRRFLAQAASP